MLAFQRGDETAFADLFARHRSRVVNTAYRFLGDTDRAQDVAQDVFIRIYTSPSSYRPDAAFSTWLYRVTANACMDDIRKTKRSRSAATNEELESMPDRSASPQDCAESSELARHVSVALRSLPDNQRLALVLQRYEGLSYQQVAEVMGLSVPAVESLLFRAKQALKVKLAPYIELHEMPR